MRRLLAISGSALLLGAGAAHAQDASLGGTMAATAMSSSLSAGSSAGMGAAMNRARQTPGGSPFPGDDPTGASGMTSGGGLSGPGGSFGPGGFPSPNVGAAQAPKTQPILFGGETGASLLNELMRGGRTRSRSSRVGRRRYRRGRNGRRIYISESPRREFANAPNRSRAVAARYKFPRRGVLASYLPEDRYKVVSGLWRFVSIEDDANRYPMRYYYEPGSSRFLTILAGRARGTNGVPRPARVIGFKTWQDAMAAGYRPDPSSRPDPASGLAYLANVARGPQVGRYAGFVFAGQIPPSSFNATVNYVRQVARIANSRRDTKPLLGATAGRVLGAALGEEALPTEIGVRAVVTVAPNARGGMMNGMDMRGMGMRGMGGPPPGMSGPPGSSGQAFSGAPPEAASGDPREQQFNNFSKRAGGLSAPRR